MSILLSEKQALPLIQSPITSSFNIQTLGKCHSHLHGTIVCHFAQIYLSNSRFIYQIHSFCNFTITQSNSHCTIVLRYVFLCFDMDLHDVSRVIEEAIFKTSIMMKEVCNIINLSEVFTTSYNLLCAELIERISGIITQTIAIYEHR